MYLVLILDKAEENISKWFTTAEKDYNSSDLNEALCEYARRIREYGTSNVRFVEVLEPTSIRVEVVCSGEVVDSQ